ncbi:MAG: bifunctional DNA-formamidopyrimidine glycosylase/DNA-(apurinic or apyrimidinic site) lyase [Planctomycetota bacterium]|nr:bifunctional DNA-formamidopyrimidine glycosylase/DNA-(apurinic or apyrimidinic site) lyase [Planctomycetota bacterium]
MPELPEVECVGRTLLARVRGVAVRAVDIRRPDVCTTHDARPVTPRDLLLGARITDVVRRGKQLAILADDGRALAVHLGMSGRLSVQAAAPAAEPRPAPHAHVVWTLDSDLSLVFSDPRRFGGLWTFPSADALRLARWSTLGPDALTITPEQLAGVLRGAASIKSALLDQRRIAGLGNIYADEVLFHARIAPQQPAGTLSPAARDALANAIRCVLTKAIKAGGTTLRDYADAEGVSGTYQNSHAVYGRAGLPCTRCGTPLVSDRIAQRTTCWCQQCQPNPTDLSTLGVSTPRSLRANTRPGGR